MLTSRGKQLVLQRAVQVLEKGWCKGFFAKVEDDDLQVCAVGALRLAYAEVTADSALPEDPHLLATFINDVGSGGLWPVLVDLYSAVIDVSEELCIAPPTVQVFNDHPRVNKDHVLLAFKGAEKRATAKSRRKQPVEIR